MFEDVLTSGIGCLSLSSQLLLINLMILWMMSFHSLLISEHFVGTTCAAIGINILMFSQCMPTDWEYCLLCYVSQKQSKLVQKPKWIISSDLFI